MSTDATFGDYGGQYVPEALMAAIEELENAYERYVLDNEDARFFSAVTDGNRQE